MMKVVILDEDIYYIGSYNYMLYCAFTGYNRLFYSCGGIIYHGKL